MSWTALPVELIVRILETVDPQVLVNCRSLSRLFKSLVDGTVSLQYRIALFSTGMADGPPSQLSTSERLSLLRSYEASWRNLDWNAYESQPVPDGSLWELYGNVWAHTKGNHTINFIQLPSRLRGIPMRQWTVRLDFAPRDFGIDPAQDLLVTVERVTNASLFCQVRFLTLSSGERHPLARDAPTLEYTRTVPENPHIRWSFSIRVNADYLGILFINDDDDDDGDGNELVVWNWKSGARHLNLTLVDMPAFTFLGNGFVLVGTSLLEPLDNLRPALLLYALNQRPSLSIDSPDSYLLRFLFQTPHPAPMVSLMNLTSDPSPSWPSSPSLQVPFQVPCDERIIAFNLRQLYPGDSRNETFLIPAKTLLGHVGDLAVGNEGRDIEWEGWGLSCAEPVRHHPAWDFWTCFVFGMRHVLPRAAVRDDRRVMIVRDLCPRRYMRASEEERDESEALYREMGYEGRYPRSIVKCVPLPTTIKESSRVRLMIGEDGIIVIEDGNEIGKKQIHLLTF